MADFFVVPVGMQREYKKGHDECEMNETNLRQQCMSILADTVPVR